jgi:hypothetical protein
MTKQRYKVELEQEIWHQTRTRAIQNGVTAGAIVEDALRQYLSGSPAQRAREQIEESVAAEAVDTTTLAEAARGETSKIPMAAVTAPVELEALPDDLEGETATIGVPKPPARVRKPRPLDLTSRA